MRNQPAALAEIGAASRTDGDRRYTHPDVAAVAMLDARACQEPLAGDEAELTLLANVRACSSATGISERWDH